MVYHLARSLAIALWLLTSSVASLEFDFSFKEGFAVKYPWNLPASSTILGALLETVFHGDSGLLSSP